MAVSIEDTYAPEFHDQMNAYNRLLDDAIESKFVEPIGNADENHGALMMTKLFEQTTHKISMLVGDFNGAISNKKNYLEAFERCLSNNSIEVRIIMIKEPGPDSEAYKLVLKYKNLREDKIKTGFATDTTIELIKDSINFGGKVVHFSIFDEDKSRLELIPEKFIAVGLFCNIPRSKALLDIFDYIFPTITPN